MRKMLSIFLLIVCVLTIVDGQRRRYGGFRRIRFPSRRSSFGLTSLSGRQITTIPASLMPVGGGLADGLGSVSGGISSGLSGLVGDLSQLNPAALIKFLTTQINLFKGKLLFIFDDKEQPFQLNLKIPDFNLLNLTPNLNEKVTFSLYDKKEGNSSFDILKLGNDTALKNSRFDPKRPTVFITHGFLTSSNGTSVTLVRDAYLKTRDYNVIAVNWSPLSVGSYTVARLMVPRVGNHVGNMINFLYKNGMNSNTTTLVGHSLGSHVMGFAGQTASLKVNHTIGLDPAWPLFVGLPSSQRLSDDDAQFVEVIHTNGGLLGIPSVTGHYDFYPNGGFFQHGCSELLFTACSHGRAYKYLAEQIEKEGSDYYAIQCNTYNKFKEGLCSSNNNITIMGALDQVEAAKGTYYLDTRDSEPFGLGLNFKNFSA